MSKQKLILQSLSSIRQLINVAKNTESSSLSEHPVILEKLDVLKRCVELIESLVSGTSYIEDDPHCQGCHKPMPEWKRIGRKWPVCEKCLKSVAPNVTS